MVVVRRRKGLSPRYLTFRHARCLLRRQGLLSCDPEDVLPGYQKLRSFHMPGLLGGSYTITAEQMVGPEGVPPTKLENVQRFYVNTPEFQLPEDVIHSVYPPQGHEEWVEALPHIIFNKPSLPWEWVASHDETPKDYQENRNRVPWLALLVFTKEELELSTSELAEIFDEPVKQTSTFAVNMPASRIKNIRKTAMPIALETADKDTSTDVILLKPGLFTSLFTKFDKMGNPVSNAGPDVRPYRYLAHRRDVNTEGMAYAALTATEDDQSSFGVIFAHRAGPLSTTEATQCIVHLVSIRGIEGMKDWPIPNSCDFVAMSSLHSWSYSCYPSTTPTLWDQFMHLGETCNLLRYNLAEGDEQEILRFHAEVGNRVLARLKNGYTLARYRVQTGESTACFMRGAFVPVKNNEGAETWERLSNTGSDLQILDQQVGIMDITYSAAWQLGRTLAIADHGFVASLGRVRKQIYDRGMQYAQLDALSSQGVKTRSQLISALPQMVKSLHRLSDSQALAAPDYMARSRRWHRPAIEPIDLSYKGLAAGRSRISTKTLESHFEQAALEVSGAYDENNPDTPLKDTPYNEFNTPFSADWMVVLRWILDRLVLSNIPNQYLVTDSSHLPPESIRFFQVDTHWMNALIDGALSLANYLDQEEDSIREAIFVALNRYRSRPIPQLENKCPPLPLYGFYVRSALVTRFPDLKLEAFLDQKPVDELMLLRHEIVNGDTMLCLFAQPPSSSSFNKIWLTQPPHQQTFISGVHLDTEYIRMRFRKAFTKPYDDDDQVGKEISNPGWKNPAADDSEDDSERDDDDHGEYWVEDNAVFLWDYKPSSGSNVEARRLLMDNLADYYLEAAQAEGEKSGKFDDDTATSALMGTQMESFTWRLMIDFKENSQHTVQVTRGPQPTIPQAPTLDTGEVTPETSVKPAPRADLPQFLYVVRSTDTPERDDTLIMTRVAQDLIFSINLIGTPQNYNLMDITITIPLGSLDDEIPCLMTSYEGSGAYMLTNVRFNPLVSVDKEKLTIQLLPRTNRGSVPISNCKDLSFILSGVSVNRSRERAFVNIDRITAHFSNDPEPGTPANPPQLLLIPDPDDSARQTMADLRASFLRSTKLR